MKSPRFWTVLVFMAAALFMLVHRGDADNVPPSEPLHLMPTMIDGMVSQDLPLEDDVLAVLGKGDFLNRIYTVPLSAVSPQSHRSAPISLFIGYFATQRTGQSIHSPQHCLPGAGWTFDSSDYTTLEDINGNRFQVGEYVISNGESRQFVIYWYQAHGRSIANEYKAKAYMLADAIRYNRTDGALVRVITPISATEQVADARERTVRFTARMTPYLPQFIPN
ncbi:exosortase C-terminal domain/associated protein EpsI [Edaphobacter albus]|uniref:exosortase C-terminal domain/associated protein EpsI n=1 Tax=Edaphobacter sp. 4G125 TaxID=2763071 RepID=UPI001645A188|nr:exosortase C-terminal domain/associated protein EpsI [Edaphobacter sp. 4G125]QNI36595.1 EpsI family protein [Edaphobacter sp. 4G125]